MVVLNLGQLPSDSSVTTHEATGGISGETTVAIAEVSESLQKLL